MRKILLCFPWYAGWEGNQQSLDTIEKYRIGEGTYIIGDCLITVEGAQTPYVGMVRNFFVTGNDQINKTNPEIRPFDEWIYDDEDNPWTEADLLRILSYDYDVVSFPYALNSKKPVYNVKINGEYAPFSTKGLKKVDGHGMGGLVKIKRKVFEKVEPYWFFIPQLEDNGILGWETEDYHFCKKVRKAGFDLIVDFDNPLEHNNIHLLKKKELTMAEEKSAGPVPKDQLTPIQFGNRVTGMINQMVETLDITDKRVSSLLAQNSELRALLQKQEATIATLSNGKKKGKKKSK